MTPSRRAHAIRALELRKARKAEQHKNVEADHRQHVRLMLQQLRYENRLDREAGRA